jgi:hypothetical protein
MAKTRRRRAGRPRKVGPRKPSGDLQRRETTLPPPEIVARRAALVGSAQDQRAGYILGVMHARGLISQDEHNAGLDHGERCAAYEALIDAPRGFETRPEGRSLATDDPRRWAWVQAEMAACRQALRQLDHRCTIALSRAIADMPEALQLVNFVRPALAALYDARDDIRRAGQRAADGMREAA